MSKPEHVSQVLGRIFDRWEAGHAVEAQKSEGEAEEASDFEQEGTRERAGEVFSEN